MWCVVCGVLDVVCWMWGVGCGVATVGLPCCMFKRWRRSILLHLPSLCFTIFCLFSSFFASDLFRFAYKIFCFALKQNKRNLCLFLASLPSPFEAKLRDTLNSWISETFYSRIYSYHISYLWICYLRWNLRSTMTYSHNFNICTLTNILTNIFQNSLERILQEISCKILGYFTVLYIQI